MRTTIKWIFGLLVIGFLAVGCSQKTTEVPTADRPGVNTPDRRNGEGRQGARNGQQRQRPQFADLLQQMDGNGDSQISKAEAKGRLAQDFVRIDSDGNGQISAEEFKNAPRPASGSRPGGRN